MTNDMVRRLADFSLKGSTHVETHGEPKASENSRKGLLKVLALTALVSMGLVATPDASASTSFSDYKAQQMADFEEFKRSQNAGGNELSAFEEMEREAEAIKTEMRSGSAASTTQTERQANTVKPQPQSQEVSMVVPFEPLEYTVTRLTIDGIDGENLKEFEFAGPPPSDATCQTVAGMSFGDAHNATRSIQRSENLNPIESMQMNNYLLGLVAYCNKAPNTDLTGPLQASISSGNNGPSR